MGENMVNAFDLEGSEKVLHKSAIKNRHQTEQ